MAVRVTADTNILISAFNFGGKPAQFLRAAEAKAFQLFISDSILAEFARVLRGKKFGWPETQIARVQLLLPMPITLLAATNIFCD